MGEDEKARMDFIRLAINDHKGSDAYKTAVDAEKYYEGENPTINNYEKILYDLQGKAHADMYTANHKIASKFFGMAVDQECSYLLGNGVTFEQDGTKDRLGKNFDRDMMEAGTSALVGGISFGFWNMDHIDVFRVTEFVPLVDEENGALMAGIRFWQITPDKPLRATLYELDGFTEYLQPKNKDMEVMAPKRGYVRVISHDDGNGTRIYDGENYPGFPIVPLKNGMVNNVDEGNLIYWVLTNCGGMDDLDDAKFVERLKTLHVAHADGDDGVKAEAHTIEAPYNGTNTTIDMLKKKLYEDFQAFDASAVSAGNQTATAIKASYVPLDLKTDKFEAGVTRFINGILELAGIDDKPSYTRNQIINKNEEIQSVLLGATYFDDEYITKKLLTILGDADQYDEMMKRKDAEDMERLDAVEVTDDADGQGSPVDGRGAGETGAQDREGVPGGA